MKNDIATPPNGMRKTSPIDRASLQKHPPPHLGRESKIASDHEEAQAHRPGVSSEDALLTPSDILSRLRMASAEPAKWMRRTFEKHRVPYVHLCGQVRATESQFQQLLDRVSCSPSAEVGRPASTTAKVELRKPTSTSASRSSVQERVTQMLRRTDDRT